MRIAKPMTEEEEKASARGSLWKAGTYDFEVHDASEEISQAGNEQIKLTVWVYNSEGDRKTVFDYLGAAENVQWKVRQFCAAVGLIAHYESGELDVNDIADRSGKLKLGIQKSDQYGDQNKVAAYIESDEPRKVARPAGSSTGTKAKSSARDLDDAIPFAPQWQ